MHPGHHGPRPALRPAPGRWFTPVRGLTATWALAIASVAGSQALGAYVQVDPLYSVVAWLVPLAIVVAAAKATSGMWVDYQERYATVGSSASMTEGLLWDLPLWPSEDA